MCDLDFQVESSLAAMLRSQRLFVVPMLFLVHALSVGCAEKQGSSTKSEPKVASDAGASLTLRVLVVNEPGLAEAINRLRGEWAERATGELKATSATWADVVAGKTIDADVIIFPSRYLGELCVRGLLRPVRSNVLESADFKADDLFPLVRQELMKWGGQVMAVPLGAQLVISQSNVEGHAALSLLARVAPQVVTRAQLGVLFDSESMKPRITEQAFVEVLGELVAARKSSSDDGSKPNEPSPGPSQKGRGGHALVPVIGYGDRLAAVTTSSRNAASAFKLLGWLASAETSSQLARVEIGALPVRRSLASSAKWYDSNLPDEERAEHAKSLEAAMTSEQSLVVPRIPGVDDYMAALDDAVESTLSVGVYPQAALEKAARRWEEITEARGRDAQRDAYLKHLGIEP
jgi:hypothetical protein